MSTSVLDPAGQAQAEAAFLGIRGTLPRTICLICELPAPSSSTPAST